MKGDRASASIFPLGRHSVVALAKRLSQTVCCSERDIVVITGLVLSRAACRSIVPQMCYDG